MKINADKLASEIDLAFREMRFNTPIEETKMAIFERNGIQVQIVLTKDEDDFCCKILDGIIDI